MMGVIATHLGMEVAMWVVLVLIGLSILAGLLTSLRGSMNFGEMANLVTRPLLVDILPLILLSWLTAIDGTGWLIRIWYYVAAVVISIRALMNLANFAKK